MDCIPDYVDPAVFSEEDEAEGTSVGLIGAIVGGSLGGLLVVAVVLAFFAYRHKRRHKFEEECKGVMVGEENFKAAAAEADEEGGATVEMEDAADGGERKMKYHGNRAFDE